jgi:hypothetical protein
MPNVIKPHTYYNEEVLTKTHGFHSRQNLITSFVHNLKGFNGELVNINDLQSEHGKTFIPKIAYREASFADPTVIIDQDNCSITDKPSGEIAFKLPDEIRKVPGIYTVEIALFDGSSNKLDDIYFSNVLYLYNEPSNWTEVNYTLPSLGDIRLSVRDSSPIENELLGNVDFDIAEICFAMARVIQYWNTIPPHISVFTTRNFPFRNLWINGTQLFLFEIAQEHYRRNQLAYSAGGLSIDDKNKMNLYRAAFQDKLQLFLAEIKHQKYVMNVNVSTTITGPFSTGLL